MSYIAEWLNALKNDKQRSSAPPPMQRRPWIFSTGPTCNPKYDEATPRLKESAVGVAQSPRPPLMQQSFEITSVPRLVPG